VQWRETEARLDQRRTGRRNQKAVRRPALLPADEADTDGERLSATNIGRMGVPPLQTRTMKARHEPARRANCDAHITSTAARDRGTPAYCAAALSNRDYPAAGPGVHTPYFGSLPPAGGNTACGHRHRRQKILGEFGMTCERGLRLYCRDESFVSGLTPHFSFYL
jgi:hypothetical protein